METHIGNREGAGYVFSMSNELFISGFTTIKELGAQFHSSFMAGRPVQCAGMISAENGIITKINNASGHYKPVDLALAKLLRHLKTVGVNIRKIDVWEQVKSIQDDGYELDPRTRGDAFLSANGNWDAIKKSGSRYEGDNSAF